MADQYYIYYIHPNGDGMFLSGYVKAEDDADQYHFTPHVNLHAWSKPLLFPTLEQVETFLDIMKEQLPTTGALLTIGRWLTMSGARRNEHPDPYEWATWRPDNADHQ